jgi:hypothetical protein
LKDFSEFPSETLDTVFRIVEDSHVGLKPTEAKVDKGIGMLVFSAQNDTVIFGAAATYAAAAQGNEPFGKPGGSFYILFSARDVNSPQAHRHEISREVCNWSASKSATRPLITKSLVLRQTADAVFRGMVSLN